MINSTESTVVSLSFDEVDTHWRTMYNEMPSSSVFDSPEWNRVWWEHFGADSQLMIRCVKRGDGSAAIVAPMKLDNAHDEGVCTFLGGSDLVDYLGFKHNNDLQDDDVAALLESLHDEPNVLALVFESLPEDSHTIHALRNVAGDTGWELHEWDEGVAPRVLLPKSEEEYFASLNKKHRHELRRKLRRLDQAGEIAQVEFSDPEDVACGMNEFMRLHRLSSIDKREFMNAEREAFFRDAAFRMAENGRTRLTFLSIDGEYVATSLSFVVSKVKYLYNSGYDPERSWHAVGLLNHALNILASIRQGFEVYDFMRGDERYKYHLGAHNRSIFTLRLDRM